MMHRRLAAIAVAALLCAGPALAQDKQPPLRTGVDGTFAPHAMPKLGGGVEGFQIDVFTEAAKRMKRDITIDSVSFSTLIPGMQSGRYDFIAAPTTVTRERAENMLFTAGYLWTAYQFGIKKGTPPIKGWEDLKGKSVSVNKGTPYEKLAKEMGEKHGFTVQVYDTQPDATQAVISGRAYATLGGNTTIVYAGAQEQPEASCRAAGRARLHEEGRHDGQVLREVVRQEAGRRRPRRRDHAGLRRAGHAGLRPDPARAEVRWLIRS